jgi:hypothetical protein
MSDRLEGYKAKEIERKLKIGFELPLHYIRQQSASLHEYLFCIDIPFPLLLLWGNYEGKHVLSAMLFYGT